MAALTPVETVEKAVLGNNTKHKIEQKTNKIDQSKQQKQVETSTKSNPPDAIKKDNGTIVHSNGAKSKGKNVSDEESSKIKTSQNNTNKPSEPSTPKDKQQNTAASSLGEGKEDKIVKDEKERIKLVRDHLIMMQEQWKLEHASGDTPISKQVFKNTKFLSAFRLLLTIHGKRIHPTIKEHDLFGCKIANVLVKDEHFFKNTRRQIEFEKERFEADPSNYKCDSRAIDVLLNFSDVSDEIALAICQDKLLLDLLIEILQDFGNKSTGNGSLDDFISQTLTTLYNCATREANKSVLRERGIVEILIRFLDANDDYKMLSLLALAFLCDETESEIFNAKKTVVYQFLENMKIGLKRSTRTTRDGWTLYELTRACHKLAINDKNKQVLGEGGAMQILLDIINLNDGGREEMDAAEALWTLSFDDSNKKILKKIPGAMETIQKLAKDHSNETMKRRCEGVLWTVEGKHHQTSPTLLKGQPTPKQGQIMISYQWKYQNLVLKVRDKLKEAGFHIWIDVEKMGGSTLQAMAEAIEESEIILLCMSETYKIRTNTRAEAEYAFERRKRIIPLRVEPDYKPDGWLGLVIGSKLYFDVTSKKEFDNKMNALIRELGVRMNGPQKIEKETSTPTSSAPPPADSKTKKRPSNEVLQKLKKAPLNNAILKSLTERHLEFFQYLREEENVGGQCFDLIHKLTTNQTSTKDLDDMIEIYKHLDQMQ